MRYRVNTKRMDIWAAMFGWDEAKNLSNIEKHGVSFVTASMIFDVDVLSRIDDRYAYGEIRQISIGRVGANVFLTVVHTDRGDHADHFRTARQTAGEEAI